MVRMTTESYHPSFEAKAASAPKQERGFHANYYRGPITGEYKRASIWLVVRVARTCDNFLAFECVFLRVTV